MKKIVLIGPVYPYKGGIAHYTGLMCKALREKYNVHMMSYKMMYPKFLFKKEQRDYTNDTFKVEDTDYFIHTANPFNCVATARRIKKIKPDLVIFQWWHPYFAPCYWIINKFLGGVRKLFVCHNVFPHERFPMDRFLTKLVLKNGQDFIVQSSMDEEDLKSIKPDAHYKKTVHPTYNAFKIKDMSKDEARRVLDIDSETKVMLFFGFVREYKGLKHLLRALPKVVESIDNVKLLVVGDFAEDKDDYLDIMESSNLNQYVDIYDGYIPDNEVEKFFAASDIVVLPYESATQSGIVQIAYGFEKPVIATNVGGLPEVVLNNRTGYIVESKNHEELADRIIEFYKDDKAQVFHEEIKNEAYRFSWDRMVEIIEELQEK